MFPDVVISQLLCLVPPIPWEVSYGEFVSFPLVTIRTIWLSWILWCIWCASARPATSEDVHFQETQAGIAEVITAVASTCVMRRSWAGPTVLVRRTSVPFLGRYSYHCRVSAQMCSESHRDQVPCTGTRPSTEELDQQEHFSWCHCTVASSHHLCAKLWSHCCRGWERTITPLFSSVFLLLEACPAAISNGALLSELTRDR